MLPFVLQTVLLLILIGGAIAYSGNYVGRQIGKKRLTLFNLRPRYTAIAITVLSGILIALTTLGVMLMISQNARTALLGLENLKNEIKIKGNQLEATKSEIEKLNLQQKELENKLKTARGEVLNLQSIKEKLSQRLENSRKGQVLFKIGEVIAVSLIQAGPEKTKLENGLRGILSAADQTIRGLGVKGNKHLIYMAPTDFDQAAEKLSSDNKVYLVKLSATRNVLWGEEVPAKFELTENRLIYKAGDEIASRDILVGLQPSEIEQEIMKLLRDSHQSARTAGVLPDASGGMGSIPYAQISELAKKIKSNNKAVAIKVQANKDIYLIGPLDIIFKLTYK
jgi:uncharacterized protein (DUF3084 family)